MPYKYFKNHHTGCMQKSRDFVIKIGIIRFGAFIYYKDNFWSFPHLCFYLRASDARIINKSCPVCNALAKTNAPLGICLNYLTITLTYSLFMCQDEDESEDELVRNGY